MRRGRWRFRRRGFGWAMLAATGALAAACGSTSAGTFHPGGTTGTDPAAASVPSGGAGPNALAWPPFGSNVHIVMPTWLPADSNEVLAVITAKDFLLAFLYAEYRGNQDDRWTDYASGNVLTGLKSTLAAPSVTTESFTGTIGFSHMNAVPDPTLPGAVEVSECFDNSRSSNTDLGTGKIIASQAPASQQHYLNTDVLAKDSNGQWHVVSVYPVVYYPQAEECRP